MWSVKYQRQLKTVKPDFQTKNVYRVINIITKKASIDVNMSLRQHFSCQNLRKILIFVKNSNYSGLISYISLQNLKTNITQCFTHKAIIRCG